jgi:hypothetical protein
MMNGVAKCLGICLSLGSVADQEAPLPLRHYLNSLHLDRLALRSIELEYARQTDPATRKRLAREMADVYQRLLPSVAFDATDPEMFNRADQLAAELGKPEANDLRMSVLQARYLHAEKQFNHWWRSPFSLASRDQLKNRLQDLRGQAKREITDAESAIKLIESDPGIDAEAGSPRQSIAHYNRLQMKGHFALAWIDYFLAMMSVEIDADLLAESQVSFYEILQIEQSEPIDRIDPKWLDFSAPISGRCLIGLGMIYTAQNRVAASQFCFQKAAEVDPLNHQIPMWRFNALLFARQWARAADYLQQTVESQSEGYLLRSMHLLAIQSVLSQRPRVGPDTDMKKLELLGWRGLLQAFEHRTIGQVVEQFEFTPNEADPTGLWIQGVMALTNQTDRETQIGEARLFFQAALDLAKDSNRFPDPDNAGLRHSLLYLLAWLDCQRGQFREALAMLGEIDQEQVQNEEFAEKANWLRCRCLVERAIAHAEWVPPALSALNRFLSEHPDSQLTDEARFEISRLSYRLFPPQEALDKLAGIPPNDPQFARYQFERIANQYRFWNSLAAQNDVREADAFNQLVEFGRQFLDLDLPSPKEKLAAFDIVMRAALARDMTFEETEELIQQSEAHYRTYAANSDRWQTAVVEYYFEANRKFGREAQALQNANWLYDHGTDENRSLAAQIYIVQHRDQSGAQPVELVPLYESLMQQMGNGPEQLLSSANARAVVARLVELYLATGQVAQAEQFNIRLLELFPNQFQYLHNAAQIAMVREDYANAVALWRTLAAASPTASENWLAAKLGQIRRLMHTDPNLAERVFRQTVALAGAMPDKWQAQFDQLRNELIPQSTPH